jgi:catechol 2,3-dioxygenase-like lactoylglutathione lyase family enzyme
MIDHVVLNVRDVARSTAFYAAALAPLGYKVVREYPGGAGFGAGPRADLWIFRRDPDTVGTHVAFHCGSRLLVDAFHAAARGAGGRDNGAPGLRPDYHPDYYGAFVLDPDGNNIEAVCHEPATPAPTRARR